MQRVIFEEPREIDQTAKNVIGLIFDTTDYKYMDAESTGILEQRLADIYKISRRTVRKIVERYNFNKYLKIDSTQKIKVINGRYRVVKDELVEQVLQYHKDNFHEYIMKYKIMAKALGNVDLTNMTMAELMEEKIK